MRVLLDSNVVLDFLERRQPFFEDALGLINFSRKNGHQLLIAAHSIDNMFYILRKKFPLTQVQDGLEKFLKICNITSVNETIVQQALSAKWKDFEDAIHYYSALAAQVDLIATRDTTGYEEQKITIVNPTEALAILATE
mgnify:CR=1 FL=1